MANAEKTQRIGTKEAERDQRINRAYRSIVDEMVAAMKAQDADVETAILYMTAAKNLERIADHATNIAEMVTYMILGHMPERERPKASSVVTVDDEHEVGAES